MSLAVHHINPESRPSINDYSEQVNIALLKECDKV
jgi:hypothetical protein